MTNICPFGQIFVVGGEFRANYFYFWCVVVDKLFLFLTSNHHFWLKFSPFGLNLGDFWSNSLDFRQFLGFIFNFEMNFMGLHHEFSAQFSPFRAKLSLFLRNLAHFWAKLWDLSSFLVKIVGFRGFLDFSDPHTN